MLEQVDVLVCGGGPTGLLTGLGLARQGISVAVIGECGSYSISDIDPNGYTRKMSEV
jgi:2-polyprenyl-6-methoxyphenol hydroxylase-like FAD-dependent oxidoreductase